MTRASSKRAQHALHYGQVVAALIGLNRLHIGVDVVEEPCGDGERGAREHAPRS